MDLIDVPRGSKYAERAEQVIPGGLNSFSRFVGPPFAFERAEGAYVWDADGNRYIDYHAAFGAIVLGHRDSDVDAAVIAGLEPIDLVGIGIVPAEVELAELVCSIIPGAEQMVACTSGSEAIAHAIRIARAATGRRLIVKVQGGYHGWHDSVARNVISPPQLAYGLDPMSAGVLPEVYDATLIAEFNDLGSTQQLFERYADQIACVIVEPIPHNVGALLPNAGYLEGLREQATANGALLVFDEVITGFRHALGGWQEISGVLPDLTSFGKAMGNGYPIAGLAGARKYMGEFVTAGGSVLLAGTFTGHPAMCAAAIATIDKLRRDDVFARTAALGDRMRAGLTEIVADLGIPAQVTGYGSVFCVYFIEGQISGYRDLMRNNDAAYKDFHRRMIDRGSLMLPMSLKRNHVSGAHTEADIDETLTAARDVLAEMKAATGFTP